MLYGIKYFYLMEIIFNQIYLADRQDPYRFYYNQRIHNTAGRTVKDEKIDWV